MDLLLKILAWIIVVLVGAPVVYIFILLALYTWSQVKEMIIVSVAVIALVWALFYLFW